MKRIVMLVMIAAMSVSGYGQRIESITCDLWNETEWRTYNKRINKYDYDNNLINETTQLWDMYSNSWVDNLKTDYIYGNGAKQQSFSLSMNSSNNHWDSCQRSTYSYDESKKLKTLLEENYSNGYWLNLRKHIYDYDTNGYLKSEIFQKWIGSSQTWLNFIQHIYVKNSDGLIEQLYLQVWNTLSNSWDFIDRRTYTYNSLKQPLTINNDRYYDSIWKNLNKVAFDYSAKGAFMSSESEYWDSQLNSWVNEIHTTSINNNDGSIKQLLNLSWNFISNEWVNYQRTTYTYLGESSINDIENLQYSIYPNPCTAKLNIMLGENREVKITISDIQGRVMKSGVYSGGNVELDVKDLPANMYFMRVEDGDRVRVEKIVKG